MYSIKGLVFFRIEFDECYFIIDLAIEQDERIIPFEDHDRFSNMPVVDIIGSSSTQSVIDIRELQFERCFYSNHRKEV